jgi:putative transposase
LSADEPVELVCAVFDTSRASYYDHRNRRHRIDVRRIELRSRVNELFNESRGSAGSRSIVSMMREEGAEIGRFKVRQLMQESGFVSKQPGSHRYPHTSIERPDISNHLNQEFEVSAPNQVWCGDITYVWAQGRWHYVAAVLDLYARRLVGWAFSSRPDADLVVRRLIWRMRSVAGHRRYCFIRIRAANMRAVASGSGCGVIACSKA